MFGNDMFAFVRLVKNLFVFGSVVYSGPEMQIIQRTNIFKITTTIKTATNN